MMGQILNDVARVSVHIRKGKGNKAEAATVVDESVNDENDEDDEEEEEGEEGSEDEEEDREDESEEGPTRRR